MLSLPSSSSVTMHMKYPSPSPSSSSSPSPSPSPSSSSSSSSKNRRFKGLSLSALPSPSKITRGGPPYEVPLIFNIDHSWLSFLKRIDDPYKKVTGTKWKCYLDPFKLANRSYAKQAVDYMLRNSVLRKTNCNMISNVVSAFVHSATTDFLNRGLLRFRVFVDINIETDFLHGDHATLDAAVQESMEANEGRGEELCDVEVLSCGRREEELIEMSTESCPICFKYFSSLDRKDIECTECWHMFHKDCLMLWKERVYSECPLCSY